VDSDRRTLPWTSKERGDPKGNRGGTSETNFEDLRKLKKGELVAAAERRPAGSRLLPKILQS
jgi:hypothetical protein